MHILRIYPGKLIKLARKIYLVHVFDNKLLFFGLFLFCRLCFSTCSMKAFKPLLRLRDFPSSKLHKYPCKVTIYTHVFDFQYIIFLIEHHCLALNMKLQEQRKSDSL